MCWSSLTILIPWKTFRLEAWCFCCLSSKHLAQTQGARCQAWQQLAPDTRPELCAEQPAPAPWYQPFSWPSAMPGCCWLPSFNESFRKDFVKHGIKWSNVLLSSAFSCAAFVIQTTTMIGFDSIVALTLKPNCSFNVSCLSEKGALLH